MISYNTSPEDAELIRQIAQIALDIGLVDSRGHLRKRLVICHANTCPLDLKRLLVSGKLRELAFTHDILNIDRSLSITTGRFRDSDYKPYFMKKTNQVEESEESE